MQQHEKKINQETYAPPVVKAFSYVVCFCSFFMFNDFLGKNLLCSISKLSFNVN